MICEEIQNSAALAGGKSEGLEESMIRYLGTEEKGRTRALWNEAFPEDSSQFCEYYFKEK